MDITPEELVEEVRRMARLAMIELNKEETKQIAEQFKSILDQLQTLRELDTSDINPFPLAVSYTHLGREKNFGQWFTKFQCFLWTMFLPKKSC